MKDYNSLYHQKPSIEDIERQNRAFKALLEYELNCQAKYDYPDWMCKPSKMPPRGERMEDFAFKYNVTIKEMKNQWRAVEYKLGINYNKKGR